MEKGRITRKDLKKPDEFILFTTKAYHWAINHQMEIFYGLIGLFVAVITVVLIQNYRVKVESKASNILFEAYSSMEEALKKKGSADAKEFDDLLKKAYENYDLLIKKYPSSKTASVGHFYKGNLLFEEGKYKEALENYQSAFKSLKGDERTKGAILMSIGYTFESLGDYKGAVSNFKDAASLNSTVRKDIIYYKMAECYSKLNQAEEAKKYFKMISAEYPNSKLVEKANSHIQEGK